MRKLQVNWLGILAIAASLVIVGEMNSKLIEKGKEENAPKSQIEQAVDEVMSDPNIIVNHNSPEGTIVTFEPELEPEEIEIEETEENTHTK